MAAASTMIGGAFLSATLQTLVEKLASEEFLDYIRNTKLNDSLLRKLQTTLLSLQAVLDDAEEKQIYNVAVKKWLDDLKDAVLDAEDLVNQITYDSLRCKMENKQAGSGTNQVLNFLSNPIENFYREINSQLKIMCETLERFAQHKDTLGLQTKSARVSRRPPSSSVVNESDMVGRDDDKDTIINMLISDRGISKNNNLGVVAILGMGGVGKTTLAQLVYNDEKIEHYFDFKVWVYVSMDFDVVRVTKSLLESVVLNTTSDASKVCESDNLDILRDELNKNTREKRFLFVLDDLWNDNYNDWAELVSPLIEGKPGSSVIITTRQQKVAVMAKASVCKLDPLSDENCWSILSERAFGSDEFNAKQKKTFEEIGRKIARKCGGLPLAAKALGGLLRSRVHIEEWTGILNSDVWNLPNDTIMSALHLSYQYLPSHLKRCFAYCSIFPKGFPLDRKKLVLLWMAEGFLDCYKGGKLEEVGDDCFAELLSRSLIQQSNEDAHGKLFSMHELFNDLATTVSGKNCYRSEYGDVSEKVRHLSYIQEEGDTFNKFRPFYNFKCLRSFLPINFRRSDNYLSTKVVDDLLPLLKRLRVLSLSKYRNFTSLPDSIGNLVQLRYLDLSYTKIKCLPDTVCNLYNLQTLNLLCCYNLTELPVHIGNLIRLRHLDISGTDIKELPMEIGGLENLQTLTVFLVGKRHEGLSIKELRKFPNLQGKFTIKNLHNVVDAKEAEEANLKNKEKIEELELIWGKLSEDSVKEKVVLEMLQPPINLKSLLIDLYGGTSFPNWLGNSSFSNMVSLSIQNCEYCTTLPPLGQLPSLKKLSILRLLLLETIGSEFYCVQEAECSNSTFQPFPSLEEMKFYDMPNWKNWIPFDGKNFAFPRLRRMELDNCPELREHLPSHLSCMEEIEIRGCHNLLETPQTLHWLSSIKKVKVKGDLVYKEFVYRTLMLETDSPLQHAAFESSSMSIPITKMIMSRSICLTHLELCHIPSLTAFPTNGLPTSLQSLRIVGCRKLSLMPFETFQNYTSLVSFDMEDSCDSLTSFPLDGFPVLQSLLIKHCRSMNSIFISESPSPRLSTLQSLPIKRCRSMNSIFISESPSPRLSTLQSLPIKRCRSMNSIFISESPSPRLSTLQPHLIKRCRSMNSIFISESPSPRLSTLQPLLIKRCRSMNSIFISESPSPRLSTLQPLLIKRCRSMNSIFISESPSPRLSTLQSLKVISHPSNESLKVNLGLDTLTNLEYLGLNCPGELSLCEGVCLPLKLQSIDISFRETKPHVKEWGLQDLPALSSFTVREKGEMDNTSTMDLMLPISLVSLTVGDNFSFELNGLQHLSSLENLHFDDCPHLKSLPENCLPSSLKSLQFSFCKQLESLSEETLPGSLKRLTIKYCPLLVERYKKKENWAKIAHIPFIQRNYHVTIM